jgi:hypothetical protein
LASLPIIPGGYGCNRQASAHLRCQSGEIPVGAIPAALPHARLASCDLEAARKQHGAQLVSNFRAMRMNGYSTTQLSVPCRERLRFVRSKPRSARPPSPICRANRLRWRAGLSADRQPGG